jgi:hypothetical protein
MATSKVWAAQDALYAALQGASLGIVPGYGHPTDFADDNVWVDGEVEDWVQEYEVSGLGPKDETFGLLVVVMCIRMGTYLDTRNAVKALEALVVPAAEADPTLGGTVMLAQASRRRMEETLLDDRQRAVKLSITIACRAWAT